MSLSGRPHYVYRHYDADGDLLYVGLTVNPSKRPYRTEGRAWMSQSVRVVISDPMSRADGMRAEREAIASEAPRHNVYRNNGNLTEMYRAAEAARPEPDSPEELASRLLVHAALSRALAPAAALMRRDAS